MKIALKRWHIITIALAGSGLLAPWWPAAVMLSLYFGLDALGSALWPSALDLHERWFLTILWLIGLIMLLPSLLAYRAKKDRRYLLVGAISVLSLLIISLFNMPLTPEGSRRWQVKKELRHSPWYDYYTGGTAQIAKIDGNAFRAPDQAHAELDRLLENFHARAKLSYSAQDAAAARQLWQQVFTPADAANAEPQAQMPAGSGDAKLLAQVKQKASWLVDQPELMMAAAILEMERQPETINANWPGFTNAILANPRQPDAWRGQALVSLLGWEAYYNVEYNVAQALGALMIAERFTETSSLHQRFEQMRQSLPGWAAQSYLILQARARVALAQQRGEKVADSLTELANQGLPLSVPKTGIQSTLLYQKTQNGRVEVDYAQHGILPDSTYDIPFPQMRNHIDRVTVKLSIDVNAAGEPQLVYTEQGSQHRQLENIAHRAANAWRFTPTGKPERHIVPLVFVDTRPGWPDYYALFDQHIQRLSLRTARRNPPETGELANQLVAVRNKNIPEQRGRYKNYTLSGQDILKRTEVKEGTNAERWDASVRKLRELNQTHPRDTDVLHRLASVEFMYVNAADHYRNKKDAGFKGDASFWRQMLLSSRQHYLEMIALEPADIRGWLGWAVTWSEEDAEVMAGAVVLARQLVTQSTTLSKRAGIARFLEMVTSRMMPEIGRERFNIIVARMEQRYPMVSSEEDEAENKLKRDVLAQKIVPAARPFPERKLERSQVIRQNLAFSETERGSVDFERIGVTPASRVAPKRPLDVVGESNTGSVHLEIDVGRTGIPTLVMVTQSSGEVKMDQSAVDTAYQWRFANSSAGRRVTAEVIFR